MQDGSSAVALANLFLTKALMQHLVLHGVLTTAQTREVVEAALLGLEEAQGSRDADEIYETARRMIEASFGHHPS